MMKFVYISKLYGYDGCGSLTSDSNKGIHMIVYDFNGMPTCVWFDNGSITDYVYTADGVKLKTIHRTAVPGTVPSGSTPSLSEQNTLYKDSTLYIGALEVNSNIKEKYHFAGGFMEIMVGSLDTYNYYNTDHLGNVRHVSRSTPSGTATIAQANNYYPFGGLLKEGEHHWDIQNRFYNGKEYDRMQGLNLYDYSARQYDPAVCQFTSMDPLCEKYYHLSPYIYCGGNPVNRIDPDGRDAVPIVDDENKVITILANFYVVTNNNNDACMGYTKKDIISMNNMITEMNERGYRVTEGEYKGYSVKFDIEFIDGGSKTEALKKMYGDYYRTADDCDISYGNLVERSNDEFNDNLKPKNGNTFVGGYCLGGNYIIMNSGRDNNGDFLDNNTNRKHEMFHTFGFKDSPNSGGIMDYKFLRISQNDINSLYETLKLFNAGKYGH